MLSVQTSLEQKGTTVTKFQNLFAFRILCVLRLLLFENETSYSLRFADALGANKPGTERNEGNEA
jgi:hypothetical protein